MLQDPCPGYKSSHTQKCHCLIPRRRFLWYILSLLLRRRAVWHSYTTANISYPGECLVKFVHNTRIITYTTVTSHTGGESGIIYTHEGELRFLWHLHSCHLGKKQLAWSVSVNRKINVSSYVHTVSSRYNNVTRSHSLWWWATSRYASSIIINTSRIIITISLCSTLTFCSCAKFYNTYNSTIPERLDY